MLRLKDFAFRVRETMNGGRTKAKSLGKRESGVCASLRHVASKTPTETNGWSEEPETFHDLYSTETFSSLARSPFASPDSCVFGWPVTSFTGGVGDPPPPSDYSLAWWLWWVTDGEVLQMA